MAYTDSGRLLPLTAIGAETDFIHIFQHGLLCLLFSYRVLEKMNSTRRRAVRFPTHVGHVRTYAPRTNTLIQRASRSPFRSVELVHRGISSSSQLRTFRTF